MHLQNSLSKFLFKKEHFQNCSLIKTLSNANTFSKLLPEKDIFLENTLSKKDTF